MDSDGESLSSVNSSRREEARSTNPQENNDDDDEIEQQRRGLLKKRNNKQIQKQLKKLPIPHVQKNTRSPFLGALADLSGRGTRRWNPTEKSKPFAHVSKHCSMLMNVSWKRNVSTKGALTGGNYLISQSLRYFVNSKWNAQGELAMKEHTENAKN